MSQQLIYGIHAVSAVIARSPQRVQKVIVNQTRNDKRINNLIQQVVANNLPLEEYSSEQMHKLYSEFVHQGVVALVTKSTVYAENDIEHLLSKLTSKALILILDGITDPHNLGACLRVADAAGVDFVIMPKDKNANITPLVSKVASGAAEFMPVVRVTNLARAMRKLKELGVWIYGTHLHAKQSLYDIDFKEHTAFVMGAEGSGIRRLTAEECDVLCGLPMLGSVGSLNVGVACGICLYEAARQRIVNP